MSHSPFSLINEMNSPLTGNEVYFPWFRPAPLSRMHSRLSNCGRHAGPCLPSGLRLQRVGRGGGVSFVIPNPPYASTSTYPQLNHISQWTCVALTLVGQWDTYFAQLMWTLFSSMKSSIGKFISGAGESWIFCTRYMCTIMLHLCYYRNFITEEIDVLLVVDEDNPGRITAPLLLVRWHQTHNHSSDRQIWAVQCALLDLLRSRSPQINVSASSRTGVQMKCEDTQCILHTEESANH
jgi:hypothetical protein